ncbi:unnamed protein product [Leuciscus chuanchicus]
MKSLITTWQSIVELQEKELPELRNRLQRVNRDIEKLKGDTEEQETLLCTLMSEEDTAKACLQDVSLMDRYQLDLKDVERKIAQHAAKLQGVDLSRTMTQVSQEKQETQHRLDTTCSKIELKRKLIQDQQEQIQALKSNVNEIRGEKLLISSNMQKRQQLEEQCVEFSTEIQTLQRDIRDAKEQMSPLAATLEKLQLEKQDIAKRRMHKWEEGQEKIHLLKEKVKNTTLLEREITKYIEEGKDSYKEQKETELQEVDKQLHELKNSERRPIKTWATSNKILTLRSERREVEQKLDDLKKNRSVAVGRQKGYEDEIIRLHKELKEDHYS